MSSDVIVEEARTNRTVIVKAREKDGSQEVRLPAQPDTPTVIDADEFAMARLEERWREFCLNAERYVAETTRPQTRVSQPT